MVQSCSCHMFPCTHVFGKKVNNCVFTHRCSLNDGVVLRLVLIWPILAWAERSGKAPPSSFSSLVRVSVHTLSTRSILSTSTHSHHHYCETIPKQRLALLPCQTQSFVKTQGWSAPGCPQQQSFPLSYFWLPNLLKRVT